MQEHGVNNLENKRSSCNKQKIRQRNLSEISLLNAGVAWIRVKIHICLFTFSFIRLFFWDITCLCSPACTGTCYVQLQVLVWLLTHRDLPNSASQVLVLDVCASMRSLENLPSNIYCLSLMHSFALKEESRCWAFRTEINLSDHDWVKRAFERIDLP